MCVSPHNIKANKNTSVFLYEDLSRAEAQRRGEGIGRKERIDRKGWKRVRLGDLVARQTISMGRGNVISKEAIESDPGAYPVFSSSATGDGIIGYYARYMFEDERISWSIDGGGRFFYHPASRYSETNVSGWIKVHKPAEINTRYLYRALEAEWKKKHFDYQTKAHPSVIKNEYIIAYPDIDTQNKIATVIASCDDYITAIQSLITKYAAIKKATVNLLLKPRHEISLVKLSDVAFFSTETIKTNEIDTKWYVGTENMLANCAGVAKNNTSIQYPRVRSYCQGDILISNIRPYLKKIWLADRDGGCSTDVNVIRCKSTELLYEYLYFVLSQDCFFEHVMRNAIGTKMPRGDKAVIGDFEFFLPTINEQDRIVHALKELDAMICNAKYQLVKMEHLKQGMMSYFFG